MKANLTLLDANPSGKIENSSKINTVMIKLKRVFDKTPVLCRRLVLAFSRDR